MSPLVYRIFALLSLVLARVPVGTNLASLGLPDADVCRSEADAGGGTLRLVAIHDPRYKQPLLLATNLDVSGQALWRLYRDRGAVEQWPLSAKPMLGAERAFVFGQESRFRLPELALLAGSLLSYVAATSEPVASGFWDQAARWVCGRTRRALARMHGRNLGHFAQLPCWGGQLRKKASVTAYLSTGVEAHRRHKPERGVSQVTQTADLPETKIKIRKVSHCGRRRGAGRR